MLKLKNVKTRKVFIRSLKARLLHPFNVLAILSGQKGILNF